MRFRSEWSLVRLELRVPPQWSGSCEGVVKWLLLWTGVRLRVFTTWDHNWLTCHRQALRDIGHGTSCCRCCRRPRGAEAGTHPEREGERGRRGERQGGKEKEKKKGGREGDKEGKRKAGQKRNIGKRKEGREGGNREGGNLALRSYKQP